MKMAVVIQFDTDMAPPRDRFAQVEEFAKQNLTKAKVSLVYVLPEDSEIDFNLNVTSRWSE